MSDIIQLSNEEHVLKRSGRYLGSVNDALVNRFYFDEGIITYGQLTYVPALLKLIREVLDNSIDNAIKNDFRCANVIKIDITSNTVTIEDNGTGIPVKAAKDSKGNELPDLMPTLAWCSLRAGSNFLDEDDNSTIGQNGEGSVLCNIFSKQFIGETCDGSLYYKLTTTQNMSTKHIETKPSKKRFTKVTFTPDLERMNITEISKLYIELLKFDLMFLKETYPKIQFIFNKETI